MVRKEPMSSVDTYPVDDSEVDTSPADDSASPSSQDTILLPAACRSAPWPVSSSSVFGTLFHDAKC